MIMFIEEVETQQFMHVEQQQLCGSYDDELLKELLNDGITTALTANLEFS